MMTVRSRKLSFYDSQIDRRCFAELTFIVHSRRNDAPSPTEDRAAFLAAHSDPATMLGDVNLFLHDPEPPTDDEDLVTEAPGASESPRRAEMEVMFPPTTSFPARSGLATHTLQVFLSYASAELRLPPSNFFARIGFDNEKSLGLFRKLGFVEGKRVEVFREVELVWPSAAGAETARWPWEVEPGWAFAVVEDPRDEERD